MQNWGMSMLWFWVCYILVTCVGILHTIFNIYVLKMKPMDENGMGEATIKQSRGIRFIISFCFLCSVGSI